QPAAQSRQRRAERRHPIELRPVAKDAPFGMIAVLFAAARVAPRGLQVPARVDADPHVFISRWYREAGDAGKLLFIGPPPTIGHPINEAVVVPHAPDARHRIGDVNQSRGSY